MKKRLTSRQKFEKTMRRFGMTDFRREDGNYCCDYMHVAYVGWKSAQRILTRTIRRKRT